MDKIPYALFDGYEEMSEANVMLASMFDASPIKGIISLMGRRMDRKGYLVVRNGRVKYSFQCMPWINSSCKKMYEEVPLKVNLENE